MNFVFNLRRVLFTDTLYFTLLVKNHLTRHKNLLKNLKLRLS